MKDTLYNIYIDSKKYKQKPEVDGYINIHKRLQNSKQTGYSWDDIISAVDNGRSLVFARMETDEDNLYRGRKNKYFVDTRFIALDFDDGLTIQTAEKIADENNIEPALIYKTFSHTEDTHKFRMVFRFDSPLTEDEFRYSFKVLSEVFDNQNDSNASDLCRLFLSTDKGVYYENEDNKITLSKINELSNKFNQQSYTDFKEEKDFQEEWKSKYELPKDKIQKIQSNADVREEVKENFKQLELVKEFEGGKWPGYESARSLMFVYNILGSMDEFFQTMKEYWPSWVARWKYYYQYDMEHNIEGHTFTNDILYNIGFFDCTDENIKLYEGKQFEIDGEYIGKDKMGLILEAVDGGINLVTAPTGSGKTYSTIKYAQENNKKLILLAPYKSTTWQTFTNYKHKDTVGFWGNKKVDLKGDENIIIATYDKSKQIYEQIEVDDYTLIIDEAHNLVGQYDFRNEAISSIHRLEKAVKDIIHITATPVGLNPNYDNIFNFKKNKKLETAYIVDSKDIKDMISLLVSNNSDDSLDIIRINNKEKQVYIKDTLVSNGFYSEDEVLILNSDLKSKDEFKHLINHEKVSDGIKVLVTTSLIDDGLNVKNKNVNNIFFFGSLDYNALIQFPNRNRNGFNAMYIFNAHKDDRSSFEIKERFQYLREEAQKEVTKYNETWEIWKDEYKTPLKEEERNYFLDNLTNTLRPNFVKYNDELCRYVVDEKKILLKVYQQLSGTLSNHNILERVLKSYGNFKKVKRVGSVEELENTGKLQDVDDRSYEEDLEELLNDDSLEQGVVLTSLILFSDISVDNLPSQYSREREQYEREQIEKDYPSLSRIVIDQKRKVNRLARIYKILDKANLDTNECIRHTYRLYEDNVTPKTLRTRISFALAFEHGELLDKIDKGKVEGLLTLENTEYSNKELREKLKQITGKKIHRVKSFLEKMFQVESSRKMFDGKTKRTTKIGNRVELSDIYGIDLTSVLDSFKENNFAADNLKVAV